MMTFYHFSNIDGRWNRSVMLFAFLAGLSFAMRASSLISYVGICLAKVIIYNRNQFTLFIKVAIAISLPTFLIVVFIDSLYYG